MAGFCKTGRELYHYLFSGTHPSPSQAEASDDPMGTMPAFDPVAAAHEVTVFSQMVDECIDIPASFADLRRLSAPEIQATENALTTLTIATPSTPSFSGLVQHIYDQLHPYLSNRQKEKVTLAAFVTFVVGPPDHPNARYALHSHLVGCHTTFNNDLHVDYSTIYIPIGVGQPWAGPEEWGPLMVFLAAGLLWPDLPFLVCHPRFLLGAHAPLDELREVFATDCPLVLFSSASAIARSDVLYHPGQVSKFAHDPPFNCTDEPFRHNSPDHVKQLIASSLSEHAAGSAARRQEMVPHSVEADLHFPLFCTPYYGFVPSTEVDLLVEILQLSSFLVPAAFPVPAKAYPNTGILCPLHQLSYPRSLPFPMSGLGVASLFFPARAYLSATLLHLLNRGEPAVTCWLYTPARLPPPPPEAFCTLVSTLSPGDSAICSPLFETHSLAPGLRRGIPLGSHVCIHLNASLPPTPFLDRTETLSFLPVQNRGGLGASQYFHFLTWVGKNHCPPYPQSHILLPWTLPNSFSPMRIGLTPLPFLLTLTLPLQIQMIFTSVCGARRKKHTPPPTTASQSVISTLIALFPSTVHLLPLRTTTHRSTTVRSGNATTLTIQVVNTLLTFSHNYTPTGHHSGRLKAFYSRPSLIPSYTPIRMSPPLHSVGLLHGVFHHTHLPRTPFAFSSLFFIRLPF